jgi:hypothetical protein
MMTGNGASIGELMRRSRATHDFVGKTFSLWTGPVVKEEELNIKKKNLLATLLLTSLLVTIFTVTPSPTQTRASATPAELAFQRLESLAGEWEGKDEHGMAVRTVFQSSISRTVIMETLTPSGIPPMMTLYSLDGNGIAIVHYCPTNNQPRMKAVPGSGALTELVFSFIDAGNLPTPETGHEHKLVIHFEDGDHMTETWTWHENGQDHDQVFHFSRKARHSGSTPSKGPAHHP